MDWTTRVLLLVIVTTATAQGKPLEDGAIKNSSNRHLSEEDEEQEAALQELGENQYGYSQTETAGLESFLKKLTRKRQRNDFSEEKVLDGVNAHAKWGDSFVQIRDSAGHRVCGGVRIKPGHVLTAAHCFFTAQTDNENTGSNNCKDDLITWTANLMHSDGRIRDPVNIRRVYKNWDFATNPSLDNVYSYDEAIVVLARDFATEFKEKFCLASSLNMVMPDESDKCYALGMGYIRRGHQRQTSLLPNVVHKGRVRILNCEEESFTEYSIGRPFICTKTGGTYGDSGGVVVCYRGQEEHNLPYLMGVIEQVRSVDENVAIVSNSMKDFWLDELLDKIDRTGSISGECMKK